MLELKRGGRNRVQTEMVEFIALPFQSSKNFIFVWSFHVVVVQSCRDSKEMPKKSVMQVPSCCFANLNLLLFDVAVALAVVVS